MLQEVPIPTLRWQTVDVDQYIFNPNGAELAPELVGDLEVVCNIPRYNPKYLSPVWNHKGQYYIPLSFHISNFKVNTRDSCRCSSCAKVQVQLPTVRRR